MSQSIGGKYRCEAASIEGLVQQVVSSYLGRAKCFLYVTGTVSPRLNACEHDRRILRKYDLNISRFVRSRRKKLGIAPAHYIRYKDFWLLMCGATGRHRFFAENSVVDSDSGIVSPLYNDVRKTPIKFWFNWRNERLAYAIGYSGEKARVRIERQSYLNLKAYFLEIATRRSVEQLVDEFWQLPFEPYGGVKYQFFCILRAVNRARKVAGIKSGPVPPEAIPWKRKRLRIFCPDAPPVDNTVSVLTERHNAHEEFTQQGIPASTEVTHTAYSSSD